MPDNFLKCPRCGAVSLIYDTPQHLYIFRVKPDMTIVPRSPDDFYESPIDKASIGCASCAWQGSIDTLAN